MEALRGTSENPEFQTGPSSPHGSSIPVSHWKLGAFTPDSRLTSFLPVGSVAQAQNGQVTVSFSDSVEPSLCPWELSPSSQQRTQLPQCDQEQSPCGWVIRCNRGRSHANFYPLSLSLGVLTMQKQHPIIVSGSKHTLCLARTNVIFSGCGLPIGTTTETSGSHSTFQSGQPLPGVL